MDDPIYLDGAAGLEQPKEIFRELIALIAVRHAGEPVGLLDVGCAAGAFLYHAWRALDLDPARTVGLDLGDELLAEARRRVPGVEFLRGSIADPEVLPARQFDVCTAMGVMSMFDELELPLGNLLRLARPGGTILLFDLVNDQPVDMLVRHRRVEGADTGWHTAFNSRSRLTYESLIDAACPGAAVDYLPFRMPFAIPKGDDPLRAWTVATESDRHQLVVAERQLLTSTILRIALP